MKRQSRSRKKKINKYTIRRFLAILIIIIIILLIKVLITKFANKDKQIALTIMLNNNLINTQKEVIIDDIGNIYFSKEDVQTLFDDTMYYNEAEKELITTHNKHTALLKVDENSMIVNDSNISLNGTLEEINKIIYLPLKDLEVVYDIEIEYCKDNNRIIIDSTYDEKIEANIAKKTKLKAKKGWFKKTVEKVEAGKKVIVLEKTGNYAKVRTELGNIGYVKLKRIINENVIREKMVDETYNLNVYKEYSNISGIYDNITVPNDKLNVTIPTFFYLDKNDKVLDKTTSSTATYANYMNWIKENELNVLPTFTNNESVSDSLLTFNQRNQAINSLYSQIVKYQFKGVNVNFETIDDVNSFYRFLIEMTPRFKESGLIVAVTLNDNLDKSKLEKITNYIITDEK